MFGSKLLSYRPTISLMIWFYSMFFSRLFSIELGKNLVSKNHREEMSFINEVLNADLQNAVCWFELTPVALRVETAWKRCIGFKDIKLFPINLGASDWTSDSEWVSGASKRVIGSVDRTLRGDFVSILPELHRMVGQFFCSHAEKSFSLRTKKTVSR